MELKEYIHWSKYQPTDMHYLNSDHDIGIIASASKVFDIHYIFAMARINLDIYKDDDYIDDYKEDTNTHKFMKTMTLLNALSYYNYALDHSWQVIYLYCANKNNLELIYDNLYKETLRDCSLNKVNELLNIAIKLAEDRKKDDIIYVKQLTNNFFNNDNTVYIRELYNHLKHRGMIHTYGLGENNINLPFSIENFRPRKLPIVEIIQEDLYEKLTQYHNDFVFYLDEIIDRIIPNKFIEDGNKQIDFKDIVSKGYEHYNAANKK